MLTYVDGPPLRSQFLRDLKAAFLAGPRLWVKALELEEVGDDDLSNEALSVVSRARPVFVYQQLIVWGDQIAMFGVREDTRKLKDRLILRVHEFALGAEPAHIVEAYRWAELQLHQLERPTRGSQADRAILQLIEARWLALSAAAAQ